MLLDFLKEIPDHRDRQVRQYDLAHILLFTILAILSNAKNYKDVWRFISTHFEKLKETFKLKWRKVPDYTTIREILIGIMPERFEEPFRKLFEDYPIVRTARGPHFYEFTRSSPGPLRRSIHYKTTMSCC